MNTNNVLRIKFIMPKQYYFDLEEKRTVKINLPNQNLQFKIETEKTSIYSSYTLESEVLKIEISQDQIIKIRDTFYLLSLEFNKGILTNPDLSMSPGISQTKIGTLVESDFIGIKVVPNGTQTIKDCSDATVKSNLQFFEDLINKYLYLNYTKDNKVISAIELYNLSNYLPVINQPARFILCMAAIEILIQQRDVSEEIKKIISTAQKEIKDLHIDKSESESVVRSLDFVKKWSITRSGSELVNELLDPNESYNGLCPVEFFKKAYDLRSKFLHDGITMTRYLSINNNQMTKFTFDLIKNYFNKKLLF